MEGTRAASPRVVRFRLCLVPLSGSVGREKFLFSGQERPSAAALARRAGPVLAPLRAAGPAAAHKESPTTPRTKSPHRSPGPAERTCRAGVAVSGLVLSAVDCLHGCPSSVKAAVASLTGSRCA
jgi:hypothetical protein